ncbi:MAG: putative lipid II flippase FtsW [Pontibacterium sp.]
MKLSSLKQLVVRRGPSLPNDAMPFDGTLLSAAGFLVLLGFVMVTSASLEVATDKIGNPYFFSIRHGLYVIVALICALVVWRVPIERWKQWSPHLMILAAFLLLVVRIVGPEINGAHRWLPLGIMYFQPSELAKLTMILYVAGYLLRRSHEVRNHFSGILIPMIPLMVYVALLALQPDYGALVVISATVVVMVFLGGMGVFHASALVMATGLALVAVFFTSSEYRLKRLQSFLDPWADAAVGGYQQVQAQIAFGRGEWFGAGLGNSVQKLLFLPEAHTDFVVSVTAEELGFVGVAALFAAVVVMVFRMYVIGRRAERVGDLFGAYVVYGIATLIGGQSLINIGVNVGAFPPKGITLPLVSFGGSSMLLTAAMLAIVCRIDFDHRVRAMTKKMTAKAEAIDALDPQKQDAPVIESPAVSIALSRRVAKKDFAKQGTASRQYEGKMT